MKARRFLPTLTTCTLSRPLSESVSCRTFANEHPASTRTSNSIAARPTCGMPGVRNHLRNLPKCRTCAAKAWTGDWVLGTPLGMADYVASSPASRTCQIWKRPGCCIFCAAPRAN